ncbi:MAG: hypothetical protein WCF36_01320 [Candidatus Nanopelagicales bacterium]
MVLTAALHRSASWKGLLAVVLGVCLVMVAPLTAHAEITRADFPSTAQVKASMDGTGKWQRGLGDLNFVPLGATPASCRSDLPFAAATESRSAGYFGSLAGKKKYHGQAQVTLYRFSSTRAAKRAMAALKVFLRDCRVSEEWVCQDCDGIWTYARRPASPRRVGDQALAWNQQTLGLGRGNGRVIAARSSRLIVVATASHQTDPESMKKPPAPTWKTTISVTKKALARAEP